MPWLAAPFALTALLYASVGFGGGSTYNALLVLAGTDFALVPVVALACNLVVVAGGTVAFARAGAIPWRRLWPVLLLSAPLAWLGGRIPIDKALFIPLLGSTLLAAGLLILLQRERKAGERTTPSSRGADALTVSIGMAVGLLSGLVGIGGGIFLSPIMHLLRWDSPRRIAGSASLFILVNSAAGILGQAAKLGPGQADHVVGAYWPLLLAVLIGGQAGSQLGARLLPQKWVRVATALLILYVAARLLLLGGQ